jgi:hypothetical protein
MSMDVDLMKRVLDLSHASSEAFSHRFVDEFPRDVFLLFPLAGECWKDEYIFPVAKLLIETQCAVHPFKKTV